MISRSSFLRAARIVAILFALLCVLGALPVAAARDKTPPTKPTNLHVASLSAHYVTLAWNPSTDNSGVFSYRVWVSYGQFYTVPQTQTSFTLQLVPQNTYSFYVQAIDGAGNKSPKSNTVSATMPADTTAPTPPVVSVAGVNPTEVSLAWTASTDDGPYLFYQVFVNGSPSVDAGQKLFAVVQGLTPETTYEFTVKARDLYGPPNVSAPSNTVTVTTPAVGGVDTDPPTAPGNLHGWDAGDGANEINLFWVQSVDNQTPQASIKYEVYQNGVLDHVITGVGKTVLYANQLGANTFTVIAVDEAGNKSAPASHVIVSQ